MRPRKDIDEAGVDARSWRAGADGDRENRGSGKGLRSYRQPIGVGISCDGEIRRSTGDESRIVWDGVVTPV